MTSSIPKQEVGVARALRDASPAWLTVTAVVNLTGEPDRTVRYHLSRMAAAGVVEVAPSYPAAYRLRADAGEVVASYLARAEIAAGVYGL